ncbi:MAG: hypothetical protein WCS75_09270, partial [Sphingomonas sp.]
MLFIYDDSVPAPHAIRQIIGAQRFGDVIRRKSRLADVIERQVAEAGDIRFVRITNREDRRLQAQLLDRVHSDEMVVRLPSCFMPLNLGQFTQTLRKLPYAPSAAIIGDIIGDEAVSLLSSDAMAALLMLPGGEDVRRYHQEIANTGVQLSSTSPFSDLRQIGLFLSFMIGATEARHFNATKVASGIFTKTSIDIAKMEAEYRFFHVVPERMRRFLLPTFDFHVEEGRASYSMENLLVPDAALQLVHHSFDRESFATLL